MEPRRGCLDAVPPFADERGSDVSEKIAVETMTEAERTRFAELLEAARIEGRSLTTLFPDLKTWGPSDFKEYGEDVETEHECPRCKYRWS